MLYLDAAWMDDFLATHAAGATFAKHPWQLSRDPLAYERFGQVFAACHESTDPAPFATALGHLLATPAGEQTLYGLWMAATVFAWDALIARSVAPPRLLNWFRHHLRHIERGSGVVMLAIAAGIAVRQDETTSCRITTKYRLAACRS